MSDKSKKKKRPATDAHRCVPESPATRVGKQCQWCSEVIPAPPFTDLCSVPDSNGALQRCQPLPPVVAPQPYRHKRKGPMSGCWGA